MTQNLTYETQSFPSQGHMTILYLLQGSCNYVVNGVLYHATEGDMIFVNPEDNHKKIPLTGEQVIEFSMGFSEFELFDLAENNFISPYMGKIYSLKNNKEEINKTIKTIFKISKNLRSFSSILSRAELYRLIGLIISELYIFDTNSIVPKTHFVSNDRKSIINTILRYLDVNYMKDITLESISKSMFLSSVYISKMFKDETGESPINHLIKIRIRIAKSLLETTTLSIRAVAEKVGYSDAYYFSKLFKKYYGISPSKIRSKNI